MFKHYFDRKPVVQNCQRTDVAVLVRHNILQFKDRFKEITNRDLDLNREDDVKLTIEILEKHVTLNLKQDNNGTVEFSEPNEIKLTYTKSNLGKGFIFWFICNLCRRRTKYLYFPPNSHVLACRRCHRLAYKSQNENESRFLRRMMRGY